MAEALRLGYGEAFSRNEYAQDLERKSFSDLVNEISGAEKGNSADALTVSTFFNLKEFADFDEVQQFTDIDRGDLTGAVEVIAEDRAQHDTKKNMAARELPPGAAPRLNLSYTINVNLPETTNIEVYNAIFSAIRRNLLES